MSRRLPLLRPHAHLRLRARHQPCTRIRVRDHARVRARSRPRRLSSGVEFPAHTRPAPRSDAVAGLALVRVAPVGASKADLETAISRVWGWGRETVDVEGVGRCWSWP